MMNVFILFIDTNMIERVSMIAFNILMHFQIIHQISWILPHGGESLPRTCEDKKKFSGIFLT